MPEPVAVTPAEVCRTERAIDEMFQLYSQEQRICFPTRGRSWGGQDLFPS